MFCKVKDNTLIPTEKLPYPDGSSVFAFFVDDRTYNHLQQAHAVCRFLYDNWRDDTYKSIDEFRQFLSIELGYVRVTAYMNEKKLVPVVVPETWSFRAEQKNFMKKLYNPLMDFAMHYMSLPTREDLIRACKEHEYETGEKAVVTQ